MLENVKKVTIVTITFRYIFVIALQNLNKLPELIWINVNLHGNVVSIFESDCSEFIEI